MPKPEIALKKEIRLVVIEDLQHYYWNEKGEELSQLGADLLLDFILEKIGPHIYNQGIADSYAYVSERLEDLFTLEKQTKSHS